MNYSYMFRLGLLLVLSWGVQSSIAQNQVPQLTIQSIDVDDTVQTVTITYDVFDPEGDSIEMFLRAAPTGTPRFEIVPSVVSGDIGFPVTSGTGKQITWSYLGDLVSTETYDFQLIADDRQPVSIQEMVDQVDSVAIRERLEQLVGIRHYVADPVNLDRCRDTLSETFIRLGLPTSRQMFPFQSTQGQNIIGDAWGWQHCDSVIIVDGHYDTVSDAPGADDNGSAVVGVLTAAEILSQYTFRKTIRFIGFDLEEQGLRGSIQYATNLPAQETIEGVLNMEMIGYYSSDSGSQTLPFGFEFLFPDVAATVAADANRGNFITNVSNTTSDPLRLAFDSAAATYVPDLRVIPIVAADGMVPPDLSRSDHAPFWAVGVPALMLTDGANFRNPHYHEPSDTIGTLNFTFMQRCIQATIATAATLAQPTHSSEAIASNVILTDIADHHALACYYVIAPNPARDVLNLQWQACQPIQLDVELLNHRGQRLLKKRVSSAEQGLRLPINHLPGGVYWVRLSDGHHYSSQRVLIQR